MLYVEKDRGRGERMGGWVGGFYLAERGTEFFWGGGREVGRWVGGWVGYLIEGSAEFFWGGSSEAESP